jgi:hypothetical protein
MGAAGADAQQVGSNRGVGTDKIAFVVIDVVVVGDDAVFKSEGGGELALT